MAKNLGLMKIILNRMSSSFFLNYFVLVQDYFLEMHTCVRNATAFRLDEVPCWTSPSF